MRKAFARWSKPTEPTWNSDWRPKVRDRLGRLILILVALVVSAPMVARAQTDIDSTSNQPLTGEVVDGDLFVEVSEGGVYPLLVIDEPNVQPPRFQIDGTVRHENVVGTTYFEMWTVLPDGSRIFTQPLPSPGRSNP